MKCQTLFCCIFAWCATHYYKRRKGLRDSDARPTGDKEVAGSTAAEVGNILSWIMTYFLGSFFPFR